MKIFWIRACKPKASFKETSGTLSWLISFCELKKILFILNSLMHSKLLQISALQAQNVDPFHLPKSYMKRKLTLWRLQSSNPFRFKFRIFVITNFCLSLINHTNRKNILAYSSYAQYL